MKMLSIFLVSISLSFLGNAYALKVNFKGEEARRIYKSLTGVQEEGAAGHFTRQGKSILCRYTNADMDDENGRAMSAGNPKRYDCVMYLNREGLASSK